jgi:hypothetical protein
VITKNAAVEREINATITDEAMRNYYEEKKTLCSERKTKKKKKIQRRLLYQNSSHLRSEGTN